MKPRVNKKLSKKVASILKDHKNFKEKGVYVNHQFAEKKHPIYYLHDQPWDFELNKPCELDSYQKRRNRERLGVSVDNMPVMGDGVRGLGCGIRYNYFGDAADAETCFEEARAIVLWWRLFREGEDGLPEQRLNIKLTGQKVIQLCRLMVLSGGKHYVDQRSIA